VVEWLMKFWPSALPLGWLVFGALLSFWMRSWHAHPRFARRDALPVRDVALCGEYVSALLPRPEASAEADPSAELVAECVTLREHGVDGGE
jgi:hypothetical protein